MTTPFEKLPDWTSPPIGVVAVTKSDTTDLPQVCRAIEATDSDGTASVVLVDPTTGDRTTGTVYLLRGVPKAGFFARVRATGTAPATIIGYL